MKSDRSRGRPKGSKGSQIKILAILQVYVNGLNLKTLVEKTKMDRKTVINAVKELVKCKAIEKTKIGRMTIHKITSEGWRYYSNLRLERTLKETKPFKFDRLLEERARKANIKFSQVGKRLLEEPYASQIFNGQNFDLILRRVISELIEDKRRKRIIEL